MYELPSKGVLLRYPELQEVTRSRIGIPASARAKLAAFIHADRVPTELKTLRNSSTDLLKSCSETVKQPANS